MAGRTYTVNFDSGIEKVEYSASQFDFPSGEITASGGTVSGIIDLYLKPNFKHGYILDTTNIESTSTADVYIAMKGKVPVTNVVFTSKQGASTMSKSYDLSTSSKWANLADGEHVVKIRAKGTGYGTSSFSNSVTVTKGIVMPVKGDLITIESKQYRVLKITDTVAEVLAMYDSTTAQAFDSSDDYSNVYANNSLDVYLSQTFYNSLSSTMQAAIVAKTFNQDSWDNKSNSGAIAKYTGTYQQTIHDPQEYAVSLMSTSFGTSISKKCYVLSVQDIIDYLEVTISMNATNTTLKRENIWKMFWNQTINPGGYYLWLRSAYSGDQTSAFWIDGSDGHVDINDTFSEQSVRPAFQIDLSKIEWSPVGGGNI